MRSVGLLLRRDLAVLMAGGGVVLPMAFFLAVAVLFPFAVGPDAELLARTGGGVIWIAALLAAILPLDRLVAVDMERGTLDQLALRGMSEEAFALIRVTAHWLSFAPLLLLATVIAATLLNLSGGQLRLLLLGLLAGTPGLAAAGVMIAALTASLRTGPALAGLLFLPLTVPLLIFGAGSLARMDHAAVGVTGAISLALLAVAPFAVGAAIRAGREG